MTRRYATDKPERWELRTWAAVAVVVWSLGALCGYAIRERHQQSEQAEGNTP